MRLRILQWSVFCCCVAALGQNAGELSGDGAASGAEGSGTSSIRPVAPVRWQPQWGPWIQPGMRKGVDWHGLAWQSGLFLGIQHSFRLATEPGTRAGLKGKFFPGWGHAAGNLHGWSDGDPFYVNYVGHPMQGAVTGFIWSHNDRAYLGAEFGANSYYWKSRLRATAYSWAYSTLFEIGPLSEASIGKVQSVYPQQGFVDHVITPVVGTGWMIAEDALDKYLIQRIERHVDSPVVRLLARGTLNPGRSMANLMRLKAPWTRDDRPGVQSPLLSSYLEDKRAGLIRAPQAAAPEIVGEYGLSTLEVSMTARPVVIGGRMCAGGGGEGAFRLSPRWQMVVDVSGCKTMDLPESFSGDTFTYVAGPRWSANPAGRWNPYAHVLVGGMKVTEQKVDAELRAALVATAKAEGRPAAEDFARYATTYETNGFAMAAGTGLDLRLKPALALKVAGIEYRKAWVGPLNGREYGSGLAFTVGAVLRMGTW